MSLDPASGMTLPRATLGESKVRDDCVILRSVRVPAATLGLCSLGLLVTASAAAMPKPPAEFWSPARCERVLLGVFAGRAFPTGDGHHFGIAQAICVGSGGPHACRWTPGHRSRVYAD